MGKEEHLFILEMAQVSPVWEIWNDEWIIVMYHFLAKTFGP